MFTKIKLIIIVLFTTVSVGIYFSLHDYFITKTFSCTANYVQYNKHARLSALVNYVFNKKDGYVTVIGNLQQDDAKPVAISRQLFFNYDRKGDNFHMKSKKVIRLADDKIDDMVLQKLFFKFFFEPHREIFMQIRPQPGNQYLFMVEPIPLYLCKQNRK